MVSEPVKSARRVALFVEAAMCAGCNSLSIINGRDEL